MSNDILENMRKLGNGTVIKEINPEKIFYNLIIESQNKGYLREGQGKFLNDWFDNYRNKKEFVGILNTGAGKTLVGLLMLLSRMNEETKPCLYLCPTKQLVSQTINEAKAFGIPAISLPSDKNDVEYNSNLIEFENSKAILVTTFERMFNGRSLFGIEGIDYEYKKIGTILIDDAHTCIEKAKSDFTISIKTNTPLGKEYYNRIKSLFEYDLKSQSNARYSSMNNHDTVMQVSYMAVHDNFNQIKQILDEMYNKSNSSNQIFFSYNLVIDYLKTCDIFISKNCVEIVPVRLDIDKVPSYVHANKIALSATFNNYTDLIENLNFSKEAVANSIDLQNSNQDGDKFFVFPVEFNLSTDDMRKKIKNFDISSNAYNIVILVPDYNTAYQWKDDSVKIVNENNYNIDQALSDLDKNRGQKIVFTNRYDGLNLKDRMCNFLIIDGLPKNLSLKEKYMNMAIPNSNIINQSLAQTIEQAVGRSVRSRTDKSIVMLMGDKLQNFVLTTNNHKFFSDKLVKQIEYGQKLSKVSNSSKIEELIDTLLQNFILNSNKNNEDLRSSYRSAIEVHENTHKFKENIINLAEKKSELFEEIIKNNYQEVQRIINEIIDSNYVLLEQDVLWYKQILAKVLYDNEEKKNAYKLQKKIYNSNHLLVKPFEVCSQISEQAQNCFRHIQVVDLKYDNLRFNPNNDYKKFEEEIRKIGEILGFKSSRPDNTLKKGPDNLWLDSENQIAISIECKNQKKIESIAISQNEMGQTFNSQEWVKQEYPGYKVYSVIVNKYNQLSKDAIPNDTVYVLTEEKLMVIVESIKELKSLGISDVEHTQDFLDSKSLSVGKFIDKYFERFIIEK